MIQFVQNDGKYKLGDLDIDVCLCQCVVYFDFDKIEIKLEFQQIMVCYVKYLQDCLEVYVCFEGNIDECGICEYNFGFGECCGNVVFDVLQVVGGLVGQFEVILYGKEKLVCCEYNEDCWSKNCCVEIVYMVQ